MADSLPAIPSLTKTYHTKSYPAISPSRPELSAAGKNIVITGGGTGIGRAIAFGFAEAKAASISILGRRLDRLEATKSDIVAKFPDVKVFCYSADLLDGASVKAAFDVIAQQVGKIHVYVSNAGVYSAGPVATVHVDEFMYSFEVRFHPSFSLASFS